MSDALDEQLIALLRRNGRESISALAARLSLPRAAVRRRLNDLLRSGGLAIAAVVSPAVLGMAELCHVSVRTEGPPEETAAALARLEAAVFVSITSGPADIVAELRMADRDSLFRTVEGIRSLPGVTEVTTLLYREVHRSPYSSIAPEPARRTLDAVDWHIIDVLQEDGRASFREVAARVGVSDSAARARVAALVEDRVMRVTAIVNRNEETRSVALGLGLNVHGDAEELAERLLAIPELEFLATAVGAHDIVATASASSLEELQRVISSVRAMSAVRRATTWMHMSLVKELYTASLRDFVPAPPAD